MSNDPIEKVQNLIENQNTIKESTENNIQKQPNDNASLDTLSDEQKEKKIINTSVNYAPSESNKVMNDSEIDQSKLTDMNNNTFEMQNSTIDNNQRKYSINSDAQKESYPRRYSEKNIEEGKDFFKERFLKEKENEKKPKKRYSREHKLDESTINLPNNQSNFLKSCKTINLGETSLSEYDGSIKRSGSQRMAKGLGVEKESRKNKSLFLKKVEKAIFCFNLKKYQDSYNVLLVNGIVRSYEEYGEFLLVISGFDKYILGEFLSKTKPPNCNKEILKSFVNCCDFRKKPFLYAFRFLLSKLNLPKDANMILEIINEFSNVYYNDNKESGNFKSTNSIYLLSSSVLALNTMLSRTDIKDMIIFQKKDFIEMNAEVSKEVVAEIYDDVKSNKMDMKPDYNEIIYQRLSQFITEKFNNDSNSFLDSTIISNKERMSFAIAEKITTFGKEEFDLLTTGEKFLKYSLSSRPHQRKVYLSKDEKTIIWENIGSFQAFAASHSIMVKNIKNITIGVASSHVLQQQLIRLGYDNNCFTIHTSQRTLDLSHDEEDVVFKWYKALKGLIYKYEVKKEKEMEERKRRKSVKLNEWLLEVWKKEILYNWGQYRKYLKASEDFYEETKEVLNLKDIIEKINEIEKQQNSRLSQKKYLNRAELLYLYGQGIPKLFRKKIWSIILGNRCGIGENLFDSFLQKIENNIDFEKINERIADGEEVRFDPNIDYYTSQLILDIIKEKDRFLKVIIDNNLNQNELMSNCFKIVRAFLLYRPDVIYSKSIVLIAMIFLLNGDDYFNCFVLLCNLICQTNLLAYLLKDQDYILSNILFFDQLLKSKLPKIFSYLKKLEITPSLYLVKWYETLYIKMFSYKMVLKIWDNFIAKGESVIFQVAIAIFKIQQDELLNLSISDIFRRFKQMSKKYKEEDILMVMRKCENDINREYYNWKQENELAKEKCSIYQYYMEEEL